MIGFDGLAEAASRHGEEIDSLGGEETAFEDWFAVEGIKVEDLVAAARGATVEALDLAEIHGVAEALKGQFIAAFVLGWTACRDREQLEQDEAA